MRHEWEEGDSVLSTVRTACKAPQLSTPTSPGEDEYSWSRPLKLFALHTHEWRLAFLRELYMQGYPALFEAVGHAWALMEPPKTPRCTYNGILAGTGGSGKKALFNFFRQFVHEGLECLRPIPPIDDYSSLSVWNQAVIERQKEEDAALDLVIEKFAMLLVGRVKQDLPSGDLLIGPWLPPDHPFSSAARELAELRHNPIDHGCQYYPFSSSPSRIV